jgi:RimJ/RimL family protein N-acetyltransferase
MSRKGITAAEGARIRLVEIQPEYFAHVVRWRNDPDNRRHFFSKNKFSLEGQREWHERYLHDPTDMTFVVLARPDIPIGLVALYNIDDTRKMAEFGRLLIGESRYRNQGLAFEACTLCLDIGFGRLDLEEVYLEVYESNRVAVGLYYRLGFTVEKRMEIAGQGVSVLEMRLSRSRFLVRGNHATSEESIS